MAYRNEDKRKQIKIELSTRVRGGSGRQLGSGALAYFRLYLLAVNLRAARRPRDLDGGRS